MFSLKHVFAGLCLLVLTLAGVTYFSTQASAVAPQAPTVVLEASSNSYINCASVGDVTTRGVQLIAKATDPQGKSLSYKWQASGGRIVGDGPNTVWDLSGAQAGTYSAMVEVNNGSGDAGCAAFSSTTVVVRECPPPICPSITLSCPGAVTLGQPITFTANISGGAANITPTYIWRISTGTIISGQGTNSITIGTTGLAGQTVSATVQVGGYGLECSSSCQTQIPVPLEGRKFDEFGPINRDDEKARLDNYAIQLQQEPDSQGYIIVYTGRRARPGEQQKRMDRLREYLINLRGVDARRLVFLPGGTREETTVELWLVPTGATPPTPQQ
jgi:hypothetical protein